MAHFDGMNLFMAGRQGAAGSLFLLTEPSAIDATQEDGLGWITEMRQGSSYVLARGPATSSYSLALNESLEAVQRGLDILCIKGTQDAAVKNVESEHLCWWMEPQGLVLRVYFISTLGLAVSAQATVTDQYGFPVYPPPAPPLIWHDSFRYFRLAQVTEDLFDAYRNTFLALESLLSTLVPIHTRPTMEREGDWFKRALSEVGSRYALDLTRYALSPASNLTDAIFNDFYKDKRNAIFHAKVHRPHFLPRNLNERATVSSSLDRLVRLYLDLVEKGVVVLI